MPMYSMKHKRSLPMYPTNSNSLTDMQAGSSAIASRINSMRPWDLTWLIRQHEDDPWPRDFQIGYPLMNSRCGISANLEITIDSTFDPEQLDASTAYRIYCIWLIHRLDERGLPEALEA